VFTAVDAFHRREHRRFLAIWALVFAALAASMTGLTLHLGPDPHLPATQYIGCTIPAALWAGCLLICILSCYTTDYIRHGWRPLQTKRSSRELAEVLTCRQGASSACLHDLMEPP